MIETDKNNKKTNPVLIVVTVLLLISAVLLGLIVMEFFTVKGYNAKIDELSVAIQQNQQYYESLEKIKANSDKVDVQIAQCEAMLPELLTEKELMDKIATSFNDSNVEIKSLKLDGKAQLNGNNALIFETELRGGYLSVMKFLDTIDAGKEIADITSLQLNKSGEEIIAKATFACYYR